MRKRILVVDDDPDQVQLLAFNLKRAGYAVGTAGDGVEALKKARSLRPDLVLLDLMLPELDGYAVCEVLRRDPLNRSVPILMITALSGTLAHLAGLEAGATDFMTKPFKVRELLDRVAARLDHAPLPTQPAAPSKPA